MKSKYMIATHVRHKPKTEVWDILSKSGSYSLGEVKWYAPWRGYCFFIGGKVFSGRCLSDLVVYLAEVNEEHKQKRKKVKK